MHVRNLGYILPLKIRGPKTRFSTILQLSGNFNGLYLPNKTRYTLSGKCVWNYKGLLHRPEISWTLVHKRFKIGPSFHRPFVNSAFHFIVMLRRWRPANGTQPNFAKRRRVNRTNNLHAVEKSGPSLLKNWGPKKTFTFRFLRTSRLRKVVGKFVGSSTPSENFANFGLQSG